MIHLQKKWLGPVPWETVVNVNQALCRDRELKPGPNPKTHETVRQLWEETIPRTMALKEVLDVCRKCHDLAPFTYNNGNTFSAIAKTLVEELAKNLTPIEAQIVRTTVGHYVVGLIQKRELADVLRHFEQRWKPAVPEAPTRSAAPAAQVAPQAT